MFRQRVLFDDDVSESLYFDPLRRHAKHSCLSALSVSSILTERNVKSKISDQN